MRGDILSNQGKIVFYDVKGIQDFIFRSNKIKEIIGASDLIKDIYKNGLTEVTKELTLKTIDIDGAEPFNSKNDIQTLYIGGGNALLYFKNEAIAEEVSEKFSKYVLEKTYSLKVTVAMISYTGKYKEDYDRVRAEVKKVEARMPYSRPVGAFPRCKIEDNTGLPVYEPDYKEEDGGYREYRLNKDYQNISKETYLKVFEYYTNKSKIGYSSYEYDEEILDKIVKKYTDSTLAIVHIDGNDMGSHFNELFNSQDNQEDYKTCVEEVRKKSKEIEDLYESAFEEIKKRLQRLGETDKYKEKILIRKIITAGDDITFIVNGQFAFDVVKTFLEKIEKEEKTYTACAGIAFCYSHFPFSNAYKVAEKLCDSAKEKAKSFFPTRSAVDFQILSHMSAIDLKAYRQNQFTFVEKEQEYHLLRRPYILESEESDGDEVKKIGYNQFIKLLEELQKKAGQGYARSDLKELQNSYHKGKNVMDLLSKKYKSRGKSFPEHGFDKKESSEASMFFDDEGVAYYYDAFEFIDEYKNVEEEQKKNKEKGGKQ